MQKQKPSAEEIKAAAESAIAARQKATDAKKQADDAGGIDETFNAEAQEAEQQAKDAEAHAQNLSQQEGPDDRKKQIDKLKRKKHFIDQDLKDLGADDNDLDDDTIDPDKPVTQRQLAQRTLESLLNAISDSQERESVRSALNLVHPDVILRNPEQAVQVARNNVFADRNRKIVEEHGRRAGNAPTRNHGAGAPRREDEPFEPTADERKYMRPPFNLSEADIKAARTRGEALG